MSAAGFGEWREMTSAPRDGTRILVEVRATEQGPAEVDLVRWARSERDAERRWVSTESDGEMTIFYADVELTGWMPLPSPLPRLQLRGGRSLPDEEEGSGI